MPLSPDVSRTAHPALLLSAAPPRDGLVKTMVAVILGSALLVLSAKVQAPFWPVPMTMQSMVVLLLGMAYGSRLGLAVVLLYLAEGLFGLPVFAGSNTGPAYMAGATGGYLAGFMLGVVVTGWLAERGWDRTPLRAFAAMAIGHAVLLASGVSWLAWLFGMEKAIAIGLTPFWAAALLKTALGALLMQAAWKVVARRSFM